MANKIKHALSFDAVELIKLVRDRPCLWDRNLEDYKEKSYKDEAWNDIYYALIPDFDDLDDVHKLQAAKAICDKWRNIRDSFAHSLRKNHFNKNSKKYVLYDELSFLIGVMKAGNPHVSNMNKVFVKTEQKPAVTVDKSEDEHSRSAAYPAIKQNEFKLEEPQKRISQQVMMNNQLMELDEDMAFFVSLLPSLRKFDDCEKLEFRMEVLKILKNLRERSMLME